MMEMYHNLAYVCVNVNIYIYIGTYVYIYNDILCMYIRIYVDRCVK